MISSSGLNPFFSFARSHKHLSMDLILCVCSQCLDHTALHNLTVASVVNPPHFVWRMVFVWCGFKNHTASQSCVVCRCYNVTIRGTCTTTWIFLLFKTQYYSFVSKYVPSEASICVWNKKGTLCIFNHSQQAQWGFTTWWIFWESCMMHKSRTTLSELHFRVILAYLWWSGSVIFCKKGFQDMLQLQCQEITNKTP